MSDITMDCDKCKEFQYLKGRLDSIKGLNDLLPDCDKIDIEHLICLMEKVNVHYNREVVRQ